MHFRIGSLAIALAAFGCVRGSPGGKTPVKLPPDASQAVENGTLACDSVIMRNRRLICVFPLSDQVRARREEYVALVMKGGDPVAFERRHGAGGFAPHDEKAIFRYEFEGGKLRRSLEMHADGRILEQD